MNRMNREKKVIILIALFFYSLSISIVFPRFIINSNLCFLNENIDDRLDLGHSSWVTNGIAVCNESNIQEFPVMCSDGAGGAFFVWEDGRNGNIDVYAQKINSIGNKNWTSDGVAICTRISNEYYPSIINVGAGSAIIKWIDEFGFIYAQKINSSGMTEWQDNGTAINTVNEAKDWINVISDGAGGAIFVWRDFRPVDGTRDIYAQRINSSGQIQWASTGLPICTEIENQDFPRACTDGLGGVIIAWQDERVGGEPYHKYPDIYAQRVNSTGHIQWTANGIPICTESHTQYDPHVCSDGNNGAIIIWEDRRRGMPDIYAQRVNSTGHCQWTANGSAIYTATYYHFIYSLTIFNLGTPEALIIWDEGDIFSQKINFTGDVQWGIQGNPICIAPGEQYNFAVCSDGAGGAIIAWQDTRCKNQDIYTQWVNSSGYMQWTANGVIACSANGDQLYPRICSDDLGGAFIAWEDRRNSSNFDIYMQSTTNISMYVPKCPSSNQWMLLFLLDQPKYYRYPLISPLTFIIALGIGAAVITIISLVKKKIEERGYVGMVEKAPLICPNCKKINTIDTRFCVDCGYKIKD